MIALFLRFAAAVRTTVQSRLRGPLLLITFGLYFAISMDPPTIGRMGSALFDRSLAAALVADAGFVLLLFGLALPLLATGLPRSPVGHSSALFLATAKITAFALVLGLLSAGLLFAIGGQFAARERWTLSKEPELARRLFCVAPEVDRNLTRAGDRLDLRFALDAEATAKPLELRFAPTTALSSAGGGELFRLRTSLEWELWPSGRKGLEALEFVRGKPAICRIPAAGPNPKASELRVRVLRGEGPLELRFAAGSVAVLGGRAAAFPHLARALFAHALAAFGAMALLQGFRAWMRTPFAILLVLTLIAMRGLGFPFAPGLASFDPDPRIAVGLEVRWVDLGTDALLALGFGALGCLLSARREGLP